MFTQSGRRSAGRRTVPRTTGSFRPCGGSPRRRALLCLVTILRGRGGEKRGGGTGYQELASRCPVHGDLHRRFPCCVPRHAARDRLGSLVRPNRRLLRFRGSDAAERHRRHGTLDQEEPRERRLRWHRKQSRGRPGAQAAGGLRREEHTRSACSKGRPHRSSLIRSAMAMFPFVGKRKELEDRRPQGAHFVCGLFIPYS